MSPGCSARMALPSPATGIGEDCLLFACGQRRDVQLPVYAVCTGTRNESLVLFAKGLDADMLWAGLSKKNMTELVSVVKRCPFPISAKVGPLQSFSSSSQASAFLLCPLYTSLPSTMAGHSCRANSKKNLSLLVGFLSQKYVKCY